MSPVGSELDPMGHGDTVRKDAMPYLARRAHGPGHDGARGCSQTSCVLRSTYKPHRRDQDTARTEFEEFNQDSPNGDGQSVTHVSGPKRYLCPGLHRRQRV